MVLMSFLSLTLSEGISIAGVFLAIAASVFLALWGRINRGTEASIKKAEEGTSELKKDMSKRMDVMEQDVKELEGKQCLRAESTGEEVRALGTRLTKVELILERIERDFASNRHSVSKEMAGIREELKTTNGKTTDGIQSILENIMAIRLQGKDG